MTKCHFALSFFHPYFCVGKLLFIWICKVSICLSILKALQCNYRPLFNYRKYQNVPWRVLLMRQRHRYCSSVIRRLFTTQTFTVLKTLVGKEISENPKEGIADGGTGVLLSAVAVLDRIPPLSDAGGLFQDKALFIQYGLLCIWPSTLFNKNVPNK